jgi:integrin alpha FG-GAP repeat containing protein 1
MFLPPSTLAQPIPIDIDGDMKIDLLGIDPSASQGPLKIWQNVWNASQVDSALFKMYVSTPVTPTQLLTAPL